MIQCRKHCRICGTEFIGSNGRSCYCSEKCREIGSREVNLRHLHKEYNNHYVRKGKMRDLICKQCGKPYRGHFNSRFCDKCLLSGGKRMHEYYVNRTYTEAEQELFFEIQEAAT